MSIPANAPQKISVGAIYPGTLQDSLVANHTPSAATYGAVQQVAQPVFQQQQPAMNMEQMQQQMQQMQNLLAAQQQYMVQQQYLAQAPQQPAAAKPPQQQSMPLAINQQKLDLPEGTYVGEVKDGKPHGQGLFTYVANNPRERKQYEGGFVKGEFEGIGRLTWLSGNSYEGAFSNNNPNGKGVKTYADKSKYIGEFLDGGFHGQGKEYTLLGDIWEGRYVNGVRNGTFTFTPGPMSDGRPYELHYIKGRGFPPLDAWCFKKGCKCWFWCIPGIVTENLFS